ncbi:MAG: hypothetical protein QW752_04950 [Thermoplasmata archaeon]
MTKSICSFKLSYWTVMRNKRISRKRALVEYSFEINEECIPLLPYPGNTIKEGEGEVHVFLLLLKYFAINIMKVYL